MLIQCPDPRQKTSANQLNTQQVQIPMCWADAVKQNKSSQTAHWNEQGVATVGGNEGSLPPLKWGESVLTRVACFHHHRLELEPITTAE